MSSISHREPQKAEAKPPSLELPSFLATAVDVANLVGNAAGLERLHASGVQTGGMRPETGFLDWFESPESAPAKRVAEPSESLDLGECAPTLRTGDSLPELDETCVFQQFTQRAVPYSSTAQPSTFGVIDCGGDVTIEIPLRMDAGPEALERYAAGIQDVWDGAYRLTDPNGAAQSLRVIPQFIDGLPENVGHLYHSPVGIHIPDRADMQRWPVQDNLRPDGVGPEWERDSPDSINRAAAHEIGHYLMAPDRYGLHMQEFEQIVGRPPMPYEQTGRENGKPIYKERNAMMGDLGNDLPTGLPELLDCINETRGVDATLDLVDGLEGPRLGESATR